MFVRPRKRHTLETLAAPDVDAERPEVHFDPALRTAIELVTRERAAPALSADALEPNGTDHRASGPFS